MGPLPAAVRGRAIRTRLAILLALLAAVAPVAAQTTTATLNGEVRTADGSPVDAAIVQARLISTGQVRTTLTGIDGRYHLESLPPGEWTVSARLATGQISPARGVTLKLQETVKLDFVVGDGPSESVTVTAEAPLIDRKQTAGILRVTSDVADSLPLAGRVATDLALLDSAVRQAAPGNFFGEQGAVFTVNGQSGRANSFLVDGLDNNDQISGTTLNRSISQLAIDEFVLLTSQFAPEFGRAAGGVTNIVTRRGGNERTWDAFVQGTTADWNSAGEFVESLPDDGGRDAVSRYQAGFSMGGPIRADRAFYFLAYEHSEFRDVIPYTGVERGGVAFESQDVVAGGLLRAPSDGDQLFLRTDYNLTATDSLMVSLTVDDRSYAGLNVLGTRTPESGFGIDTADAALSAAWTSVIAPNVINEVRFAYSTSSFDQVANSDRPGVGRPSGIFGGNNLNRQERDEDLVQLVENVTWTRRGHTVKLGLDVTHSRTDVATAFNPNGNFGYGSDLPFEPGDCGNLFISDLPDDNDPYEEYAIPCPGQIGVDDDGDGRIDEPGNILTYPRVFSYIFGQPTATLSDTKIALFAQDRWQATPSLQLDYGVRYDVSTYTLPDEAAVDSTIPNGGASRDTDNIAPRFGFSYSPKNAENTVIRGGAGVFYDKIVLGFPAVAAITSGTEIGLFFPQGTTIEITEQLVEERGIEEILPELFFPDQLVLRFSTAPELETPYTVQLNLGFETAIGARSAFSANAIRAQGYHVPIMRDLNPVTGIVPFPGICPDMEIPFEEDDDTVGLPCHNRDPARGSIAALTTDGRSWYTGLDLKFKHRGERGWFQASYTLSKAEDLGFDPLKDGFSLPPTDDLSSEKGRADGDRRHRLVVSGDLPLGWMGLRASGVLQMSSGLPFNVTTGVDDNFDGSDNDRPDGVGRNTGEDTPLGPINALREEQNDVFRGVAPGDPGLLLPEITSLDEPSFSQVDVRLYRPFEWNDGRGRGEVFLQVFNLFDRFNAGLIEGRAISRNFGEAISLAGPPRTIELGLRVGY